MQLPLHGIATAASSSANTVAHYVNVSEPELQSWSIRKSWLFQGSHDGRSHVFCMVPAECRHESIEGLILLLVLCSAIVSIVCAFAFFREDREDQITPLVPQLVVKTDSDLYFKMPLDVGLSASTIRNLDDEPLCKVTIEWPDPNQSDDISVAARVTLLSTYDSTLATVVARSVQVAGQGLALCRNGVDIFGFVEPEGPKRFVVRHRAGVHLLTLIGEFSGSGSINVVGVNPGGHKVCQFQSVGNGECRGRVLPFVDAGMVICAILSTVIHQRLPNPRIPGAQPAPPIKDTEAAVHKPEAPIFRGPASEGHGGSSGSSTALVDEAQHGKRSDSDPFRSAPPIAESNTQDSGSSAIGPRGAN